MIPGRAAHSSRRIQAAVAPGTRESDRGTARDDQVAFPFLDMTEATATVWTRDRARIRAFADRRHLSAGLASHRDLFLLVDGIKRDRLAANGASGQARGATQMVHRATGA